MLWLLLYDWKQHVKCDVCILDVGVKIRLERESLFVCIVVISFIFFFFFSLYQKEEGIVNLHIEKRTVKVKKRVRRNIVFTIKKDVADLRYEKINLGRLKILLCF